MLKKIILCSLIGLSFGGLILHTKLLSYFAVDDAFISFRYAQNLMDGHGLVFNPGERVEGYTNFLWIILMVPFLKLGGEPLTGARILGTASALLLLLSVLLFSLKQSTVPLPMKSMAGLFCACGGGIAAWAMGGLETVLFAWLVFAGAALLVTDTGGKYLRFAVSALCFAFASLTRPEGLLVCMAVLFYLAFQCWKGHISRAGIFVWIAVLLVILAPYQLWRITYFGHLFPNTYYVKSGGGWEQRMQGLLYFKRFFLTAGIPLLFLPLLFRGRERRGSWILLFMYISAVLILGVIFVGGDWMPMYRFFVPVLPFLFLLLQESFGHLYRILETPGGKKLATVTVALCLLGTGLYLIRPSVSPGTFSLPGLSERGHMLAAGKRVEDWSRIGRWLKDTAGKEQVVAAATIGTTAYYSELPMIDTFGMTDQHIAHSPVDPADAGKIMGHRKGDGRYVIGRRPDYIFGLNALTPVPRDKNFIRKFFWSKTNREIWATEAFRRDYRFYCLPFGEEYINFFKRVSSGRTGKSVS